MLTRLIKGDGMRKSRLHNYNGQFLDPSGFLYLPRSVGTTLMFKLANRRPELPWLGFRAINHLERLVKPNWSVLEFGSGMSTVWFARRCRLLVSVETNRGWYNAVSRILAQNNFANVDYRLSEQSEHQAVADYPDSTFDLVLVDGYERDRAMQTAISKVKRGGYIYLDNSDVPYREHRTARALLLEAAGAEAEIKFFNDLYPTQLGVNEGMLVRVFNQAAEEGVQKIAPQPAISDR